MQSVSFTDFDEFAGSVRGVEAVMTLQHLDRQRWTVEHADLSDIHVQRGRLGSGNIVEGRSSLEGYLIYLPLTDACKYSANGAVVPKGSFVILEPGSEFCVSTQFEHDWCSILVPTQKLSACCRADALPASGETRRRVSGRDQLLSDRFRHMVFQTLSASPKDPQFKDSRAATAAASELQYLAAAIIQPESAVAPIRKGAPRVPRDQIIRRCQQLIEERGCDPVHMDDLRAATNTSERTLRRAFHDYYGTGPRNYLQSRQAHLVHRALKAADSEAHTVTEILFANGVWELGRFASRYRKFFGELPSETLRGKRHLRDSGRAC